jgi:hypothetical protein
VFGLLVSAASYREAWSAAALAMVAASALMHVGRRMLVAERARREAEAGVRRR